MTRWILASICAVGLAAAPGCSSAPEPAPPAAESAPAATPPAETPAPAESAPEKPEAPPASDTAKPPAAASKPEPPETKPAEQGPPPPSAAKHGPGVYAHITTNHGAMVAKLFENEAPRTVETFVGLAEGKRQWRDPRTGRMVRRPYYNNLTFHRIIPNFMIQGGDPLANGTGGAGFSFPDEFHPSLRHSKPGILSMANAGPDTNNGQFFITLAPTPWLDGKHSVFGELVEGTNVLMTLGKVPTNGKGGNPPNQPLEPVVIKSIRIERVS